MSPEQEAWLQQGIDEGWCSSVVCVTHAGMPYTVDEMLDDSMDWCAFGVRIWMDGEEVA